MPHPEEHVSETRHWARMMEMAKLGAIPGPTPEDAGVNRACLTDLDRDARRLLIGWAEAIGLQVSIDAAANLWLRMDGRNPDAAPVLMGSHMDSQPAGGRFDGIWGVLAGFEALEAIHDAGLVPSRPIELVAWTNEEGGRFAPGCMGSMAWSGHSALSTWDEVEAAMAQINTAWGRVRDGADLWDQPTVRHRGSIAQIDDRAGGTRPIPQSPYRFSDARSGVRGPAPHLGEHNVEVLGEWLGRAPADVAAYLEAGILIRGEPGQNPAG